MEQNTKGHDVTGKGYKTRDPGLFSEQTSSCSVVSLKSDHSNGRLPPVFSPGPGPASQSQSGVSVVSLHSDHSKFEPPNFSPEPGPTSQSQSGVSHVSLKSDHLKFEPPNFSLEPGPTSQAQGPEDLGSTFKCPEDKLDFLRRMDQEDQSERLRSRSVPSLCSRELKTHLQHKFNQVSEGVAKDKDSAPLQQIYTKLRITEGGASEVNQEHEVIFIESMSRRPAERPVTCEDIFKLQPKSEQPIRAELTEKGPIRTVMTKGVAGIGKTVLTQKFSLDWAEDKTNQDIDLLLPFTFRELNVLQNRSFSLVELLHHCFSQTKGLSTFEDLQVLFIFDGLDECRLPLDFQKTRVLTDPTERASVEELLVNLIRGDLLPSARLWITTRPAAANQIPAECVSMVIEVQGFNDPQKEQYFMKRFKDEQQASAVIKHIKSVRSLYIMCYIPIFSWMLSTVLKELLELRMELKLPNTLTEMYIHFLVVQAKVKDIKYHEGKVDLHWTPETRKMVRSLGKLAFEQLLKGNLIFYKTDLRECGLDASEIARYSGVFTEIFREESSLYQDKVYCFIHLTIQEFLGALHVHETFYSSGVNLLSPPPTPESSESATTTTNEQTSIRSKHKKLSHPEGSLPSSYSHEVFFCLADDCDALRPAEDHLLGFYGFHGFHRCVWNSDSLYHFTHDREFFLRSVAKREALDRAAVNLESFYRSAVDLALQSPDGRLDMFLRFLLGLSLPTNDSLLSGLLTHTESNCTNQRLLQGLLNPTLRNRTNVKAVWYIKQKLAEEGLSVENRLNLLHCLNELNGFHPCIKVQIVMREGLHPNLYRRQIIPGEWSAFSFLLLSSDLEHFDLREYQQDENAFLYLLPVIKVATKAILSSCNLSSLSCAPLASVLSSSSLKHLDLSNNDLQDSGVELLCEGLKSAPCGLETLSLSSCNLSSLSCAPLASVLSSSSLKHLDLSNNDLQDSGVELLCEGLKSAPCRLETLRLSGCLISERGGACLAAALSSAPSHLRELDLSYNHPGASAELLKDLRNQPGCCLDSLRLEPSGAQWLVPGVQKCKDASHLKKTSRQLWRAVWNLQSYLSNISETFSRQRDSYIVQKMSRRRLHRYEDF